MRVFLDDVRDPPNGWVLARTAEAAIELLERGDVEVISLDHDLGLKPVLLDSPLLGGEENQSAMTGYDVACWIEEQVIYRGDEFKAPEILCHSANPIGRQRIMQAINSIRKLKK